MPALRVATHNVRGLLSKSAQQPRLMAFMELWSHFDIVCVQETRVWDGDTTAAEVSVHLAASSIPGEGWRVYWGPAGVGEGGAPAGGTAIFVRASLLLAGSLLVNGPATVSAGGRCVSIDVAWGGHAFSVLSTYLPSAAPAQQRAFIQEVLAPIAAQPGSQLWGGDFNFAMDVSLDRISVGQAFAAGLHPDIRTAEVFNSACVGMVDVFRRLHPERRAFTFVHRQGAARLDRLHVSEELAASVQSSRMEYGRPSDHNLLRISISPSPAAQPPGKGLRRSKLHFFQWQDLRGQLNEWLLEQDAERPSEPAALLTWWPVFKRSLSRSIAALNRIAKQRRIQTAAELTAAQQDEESAMADLRAGDPTAAVRVVDAQSRASRAALHSAVGPARRTRLTWLRTGERPCPAITRLFRPPAACRRIPALQRADGTVTADAKQMATAMVDFWQSVSTAAAVDPVARAQVLQALREAGTQCPQDLVPEMGRPDISAEEVRAALSASPPARAPGADGIPSEIYQHYKHVFASLLSAIFSAAATEDRLPTGFLDGVISCFHKAGDRSAPANYRPITLLDTDYRILARVMAARLRTAFGVCISPEQTAFLKRRRIADNILLLQLAPELLRSQQKRGCVAFLDFHKAYDTLDRSFLFDCLEALGVGEGFMSWVRRLHAGTRSAALVNGHLSAYTPITAGVRQGCPLAPLLYLAPAQALLCWLKSRGYGIPLSPQPPGLNLSLSASQYADDYTQFLRSLEDVPGFLVAMATFGAASGQKLNRSKSEVMEIGCTAAVAAAQPALADQPASAGQPAVAAQPTAAAQPAAAAQPGAPMDSLRVVAQAKTLGVHFTNSPPPSQPALDLANFNLGLSKAAAMPLSAFGRASSINGYVNSKLYYGLEFSGLPPASQLSSMRKAMAATVDRKLSPAAHAANPQARLPGVGYVVMCAPIKCGGFGLKPIEEHVRARHAMLAVRAIVAAGQLIEDYAPPWAPALAALLREIHHAAHPLCLLTVRTPSPRIFGRPAPLTCPALGQLIGALAHLPPAAVQVDLEVGAWVCSAPTWGNLALPGSQEGRGLESDLGDLVGVEGLRSVGGVVRSWDALARAREAVGVTGVGSRIPASARGACTRAYISDVVVGVWGLADTRRLPTVLKTGVSAVGRLSALVGRLPESWVTVARTAMEDGSLIPTETEALGQLARVLGWKGRNGEPVLLEKMTTRVATDLQMDRVYEAVALRHEAFAVEARGGPVDPAVVEELKATLARLLVLKWENEYKEVMWRLLLNGFPGFSMHAVRGAQAARCPCGDTMSTGDRLHHFWECPIAQSLRTELEAESGLSLARRNLWLLEPLAGMNSLVWDVVCLSAVHALEHGRRWLYRSRAELAVENNVATLNIIRIQVIAKFWGGLHSFAALGVAPKGWHRVPIDHPFLFSDLEGRVKARNARRELGPDGDFVFEGHETDE